MADAPAPPVARESGRDDAHALSERARTRVAELSVRDFRNLERVDVSLPPEGIAIVGENGQGKTSFLEAVAYVEQLRSVRGARDRDLVRFDAPAFHVMAVVHGPDGATQLGAGADRAGRKKVTRDGVELSRITDALGALPSVLVAPRDVALVSDGPAERRRFLDITLALTSPRYLRALRHYRSALDRRNAALREALRHRRGADAVSAWEPALAEHGAVLVSERRAWVERHAAEFTRLSHAIGEPGTAVLSYATSLPPDGAVEDALRAALDRLREHDLRRGSTHAGPHRDDLSLTLDGRDLRVVGSAGQQRTGAIALRLLEAATLRERRATLPVLLLDDPFAELDNRRAARVLDLLLEAGVGQVVLCVPRPEEIPARFTRLARYRIAGGVLAAGA
ncbi:MAG: DNA replication and repair protein RecF [Gemmatimonadetes bacterium]|nr:DNA replication and repair protein RecF [Gemmatimonadota bacterium]